MGNGLSLRLFIENPPPFKRVERRRHNNAESAFVDGSMAEGEAVVRHYLAAGLQPAGFHQSDLDPFETSEVRGDVSADRFDTFEYAQFLQERLGDRLQGTLVPHHIGVYEPAADQVAQVEDLSEHGVNSVVVVGKPHGTAPDNAPYKADVEEVLGALAASPRLRGFEPGAIGIHLRPDEPERIARKFEAAGGQRLRVMGQFLDEADSLVQFIGRLADAFEARGLDVSGLEFNVGLAIFGLKNRGFYARLLRKNTLACEERFAPLRTRQQRLDESIRMNLEFADRAVEAGRQHGLDIGFSLQPLIEYLPTGRFHPAVDAVIRLAKQLEHRYGESAVERFSPAACS